MVEIKQYLQILSYFAVTRLFLLLFIYSTQKKAIIYASLTCKKRDSGVAVVAVFEGLEGGRGQYKKQHYKRF